MRNALFLSALLAMTSHVSAEDIPMSLQVELQSAMLSYTDSILVDGAYSYVDTEENKLKTVYPSKVHPFVVAFGDDYFVCSEMIDENGNSITADFLVRRIGDQHRVVQLVVDDRPSIEGAMKNLSK